jgi:hypothetical protein
MNNLVSKLKQQIVKNEQTIEQKRSETLNKVNKICNSEEMKKVLKDTGFLIEDRGTFFEYMKNRENQILTSKFKSTDGLEFKIDYTYGDYHSSINQHLIARFKIGDCNVDYSVKGKFTMSYCNKEEDFKKLNEWYQNYDRYTKVITSTPIKNLLVVLNEYVVDYNNLLNDINEYTTIIQTLEQSEIEDTINDFLSNGGELELGIHKECDWDYDENDERVFHLNDVRETIGLDYKDLNGVKEWDTISKIKVLNKVKGKQSWEVELYRHSNKDINTFTYYNTGIITKQKLSNLIESMIESNKKIDTKTQNSIDYYNEKTSNQLVK